MIIMNEDIFQKIDNQEVLIIQLNDKIDNFLGIEEISDEEINEIHGLRKGIEAGNTFH